MKRVGLSLLIAYAATMTIIVAWLGCRALLWRRLAIIFGYSSERTTLEELLIDFRVPTTMTSRADFAILSVASIQPVQIAAVAGLLLLGTFALAARRGASHPTTSAPSKD